MYFSNVLLGSLLKFHLGALYPHSERGLEFSYCAIFVRFVSRICGSHHSNHHVQDSKLVDQREKPPFSSLPDQGWTLSPHVRGMRATLALSLEGDLSSGSALSHLVTQRTSVFLSVGSFRVAAGSKAERGWVSTEHLIQLGTL